MPFASLRFTSLRFTSLRFASLPLLARALAALLSAAALPVALAEPMAEHVGMHEHTSSQLLFFTSAEARHLAPTPPPGPLNEDAALTADIVLALNRDKFRVFAEYMVSTEEHDLERCQFGYEPVANTLLWLGRFHQPASAWNTEHHHGRYLQTSVTRPSVELWEDEHGVIPQHLTGLLVESRQALGEGAGLQLSLGVGLGPQIEQGELEPFDMLSPHREQRRGSWSARAAYLPDFVGATSFGLLLAHHDMPVADASIADPAATLGVRQSMVGAYGDWHHDPWRVLATLYALRLRLDSGGAPRDESVQAGYLQAERQLPNSLTVYGRVERSNHAEQSSYIASNPESFALQKTTLGLRWDLAARQALTFEFGQGRTLTSHPTEWRLQWSAAFR